MDVRSSAPRRPFITTERGSKMSKKKYDFSIVMGRFEPFHLGHNDLCDAAEKVADQTIILTGSANQARTPKDPFTAKERREMIAGNRPNAIILPMRDFYYSDENWVGQVQEIVEKTVMPGSEIVLVGHVKDASSYYLRKFPQWDFINRQPTRNLSATDVRNILFAGRPFQKLEFSFKGMVPDHTNEYLQEWTRAHCEEFEQLKEEHTYYLEYPKLWGQGPHITTDALVICGGCVLLVRRADCPGKGLWALPGGFLGLNERIEAGTIRELKEETSIDCPAKVLTGSIVKRETFDHPYRSLRGRVITHCSRIDLQDIGLPKVKAASDAKLAEWKTIAWCKANPQLFFEDHYHIFESMTSGGYK